MVECRFFIGRLLPGISEGRDAGTIVRHADNQVVTFLKRELKSITPPHYLQDARSRVRRELSEFVAVGPPSPATRRADLVSVKNV